MRALVALGLAMASGCASVPKSDDYMKTAAVLEAPHGAGVAIDGRARFRQVFCEVARQTVTATDPECAASLWKLRDEPTPSGSAPLPPARTDLRLVIVPGALNDCFGPDGAAFNGSTERMKRLGVDIHYVPVSGRSSAGHNARQIADFVTALDPADGRKLVLLGYSKGPVDIEEFLGNFPELAKRVAAVVSVAGPIWGSPLASQNEWLYDHVLAKAFSERCDPGDAGLLRSLKPDVRAQWQAGHPFPPDISYYFVGAFTTSEHLARGLRGTWRTLAKTDTRNDGQVLIGDEVQPGGTLLGYANADHWGVAITIERELGVVGQRDASNTFPQDTLLQAIWLYVGESLAARATTAVTR